MIASEKLRNAASVNTQPRQEAHSCEEFLIADMAPMRYVALMLLLLPHACAAVADYASVRQEVQKAYAQQAEEMARAVANLQSVSAETSAAIHEIETKCG